MSEIINQQQIRLEAPRLGIMLWRNQSGACYDESGRLIRYGLGNDSAQINKRLKSSDLIGITPIKITHDMVGQTIGVFTAIEVKNNEWHGPRGDREKAQETFIELVKSFGGLAGFANSVNMFRRIINKK